MDDERDKIISILNENQDKDFVKRIYDPGSYPTLDLGNGNHATHMMSWSTVDDKAIVYPRVIHDPVSGKLNKLSSSQAVDHALKTKQFIEFDNPEDADWFSKNYKKVWER